METQYSHESKRGNPLKIKDAHQSFLKRQMISTKHPLMIINTYICIIKDIGQMK